MSGSSADPDRTARALTAAVEAGRDLGLTVTEPVVLHDIFSVVVHLAPSPVVVRVPTVLPIGTTPASQARQQKRELDVVAWLRGRGHPVVAPSPLAPTEPVARQGFSMTFWEWVDHRPPPEQDWDAHADRVADLHLAMRDYPGDLGFLTFLEDVPAGLDFLRDRPDLLDPDDLTRATREWQELAPILTPEGFAAEFPHVDTQPVHGDAPSYNALETPEGVLDADFELTCRGPIELDLAHLSPQAIAAYTTRAEQLGLRTPDERVLAVMNSARMLLLISVLSLVPQLPILADGLRDFIEGWRGTKPGGR